MKPTYLKILFFLFVFSLQLNAQTIRLLGMGNLFNSVDDIDNGMNIYDFSGNLAWMFNDEKVQYLNILPAYLQNKGDYKRTYNPNEVNKYGLTFSSLNPMGDNGTFYGETQYSYENRFDVSKTLRYEPYSGEAFFYNDTTTGGFNYSSTSVMFKYSYELFPSVFIGAGFDYLIIDGLKNIYSSAKTLIREVGGNAGAAYKFSDDFVLGISLKYLDNQEKIESQDANLADVKIYSFKGDYQATSRLMQSVNEKIKRKEFGFGPQIYWKINESIETILKADYHHLTSRFLEPYISSLTIDNEVGYSTFDIYDIRFRTKIKTHGNLNFNLSGHYNNTKSWSKNTPKELLLWKWKIQRYEGGAGITYNVDDNNVIAAEYILSNNKSDSLKYIDNKYNKVKSLDHEFKIGSEVELIKGYLFRAGYNIAFIENDLLFGGRNVVNNKFTFGLGFRKSELLLADIYIGYDDRFLRNSVYNRSNLFFNLQLRLLYN